jgi:drug/metabolite transporter (DMT)-like permease
MTADSPADRRQHRPLLGIALKVVAVAFFISMFTFVKLSGKVPPGQIVFFRSAFAIIPVLIWVFARGGGLSAFRTVDPIGHLKRGVIGVTSMGLGFYGLTQLPLPEAVTIGYAMPLITVVMGAVLLKEQVRIYRWSAVLVGLVGVLIVSWPRLTVFTDPSAASRALGWGALSVLGSAAFAAGAMIQVRRLIGREAAITIVIYFTLISASLALLTIPFGWSELSKAQWFYLIMAGMVGGVGQILLTSCYRYADVSTIAPFEYVSLLLSLAIGYVVFSDVPTGRMMLGAAIVVSAGLFIIWREHRLGLERRRAKAAQSL